MIKITNGVSEIEVTKGVYKEVYSRQGYVPVVEHKAEPKVDKTLPRFEKPYSEMNRKELEEVAAKKGIDVTEAKTKREVIDKIIGSK